MEEKEDVHYNIYTDENGEEIKELILDDETVIETPEEYYERVLKGLTSEELIKLNNNQIVEHILHSHKEGKEAFGEWFRGVDLPYQKDTTLYEWQPYDYLEIKKMLKEHHISILKDTKRKRYCTFSDTDKYTIEKLRKLDMSYRPNKKKKNHSK